MAVNLSLGRSIQSCELIHKVFACLLPACGVAHKVREAEFGNGARRYLCLEEINLIEEENEGRVLEPM